MYSIHLLTFAIQKHDYAVQSFPLITSAPLSLEFFYEKIIRKCISNLPGSFSGLPSGNLLGNDIFIGSFEVTIYIYRCISIN